MPESIIEASDIRICKTINGTKQLISLCDQKIKKGSELKNFGTGSGIAKDNHLYVLRGTSELIAQFATTSSPSAFDIKRTGNITIDWDDGTIETNVFSHKYVDLKIYHEIKFFGNREHLIELRTKNMFMLSIDVTNAPKLQSLNCNGSQIGSLDVSNNKNLRVLACNYNQLSSLNTSNNIGLTHLDCADNQLSALDVSNNVELISLTCANNPFITDTEKLTILANSLVDRTGKEMGHIQLANSSASEIIQNVCNAKNWQVS